MLRFFKKIKASVLDYTRRNISPSSGRGVMYSAAKLPAGLLNYQSPSWIRIDKIISESRRACIDSPEIIAIIRTLTSLVIGNGSGLKKIEK